MTMQKFQKAELPDEAFDVDKTMAKFSVDKETAQACVQFNRNQTIWKNDQYQVNVQPAEPIKGFPAMIWLSIKRLDKGPVHDWRDLQTIKNMIVGPEHEAVELYPAESRLMDTANQYHLWALADPAVRFPFGFHEGRHTASSEKAEQFGAKQRQM